MLVMRQQVMAVQLELETVRQDNVKLYEKVKFVQTYSNSAGAPKSPSIMMPVRDTPYPGSLTSMSVNQSESSNAETQLLARYSNAYEARLNPFEAFGRDERTRRYQALQPHEKMILSVVNNLSQINLEYSLILSSRVCSVLNWAPVTLKG